MAFFRGRKEKFQQVPTKTAGQRNLLNEILSNLGAGGLGGQGYQDAIQSLLGILQGSPESMRAIEAPTRQAFQEQTIPNILERFSGAGAGSSSGLQQTLAGAGRGLERDLAAQRAGMQQSAAQTLLNNYLQQAGLGLGTNTFENIMRPAQTGFGQSLLGSLGGAFGNVAQGYGQNLGIMQILQALSRGR